MTVQKFEKEINNLKNKIEKIKLEPNIEKKLEEKVIKNTNLNKKISENINIESKKINKQHYKDSKENCIDKLINIIANIYDDRNIDFDFMNIYKSLNNGDKYNLQFILQREIETGYIYGYEMVISMIELENKGSKLIRFNKFAKNTNKQLLEMLINELEEFIPYSNKRKAYKIIYSIHKPETIKEWLKKIL